MKKLHTYYLAENAAGKHFNAGVVRKDNEGILQEEGFTPLHFRFTKQGSLLVKLARLLNMLQLVVSVKPYSMVLFQLPVLATACKWLQRLLQWRGIKTVALIIDIDGIRDQDDALLKKEIAFLSRFDHIIAHNPAMQQKLLEYLSAATSFSISLFDYPHSGETVKRQLSGTVCFAGNISKSSFVCKLQELKGICFHVYGEGYPDTCNQQKAVIYKGVVAPELLPKMLEGSFGLVWDGDRLDKCDPYLRYNNPHKLSLYLAAGLPVIVWSESAVAPLVISNKIGICLHSLVELPAIIDALTAEEYETMRQNVLTIGERVKRGYYLKTIIAELKDKAQH